MPFKDISYLELVHFGRGHHEEQLCEIILNLDQWFKRRGLKDFLFRALAALCSVERNHNAILVEGNKEM